MITTWILVTLTIHGYWVPGPEFLKESDCISAAIRLQAAQGHSQPRHKCILITRTV
jgi:hypothetical protein